MSSLLEFVETTKISPRFFFRGGAGERALEEIAAAFEAGAETVALTGESGLGKTAVLTELSERLEKRAEGAVATALIAPARLPPSSLLQLVCARFGARGGASDAAALRRRLRALGGRERPAVLMIDDADALDLDAVFETLEAARDPGSGALMMRVVLAGRDGLEARRRAGETRIGGWFRLTPLSAEQSRAFIGEWLEAAGRLPVELIAPAALDRLALRGGGSPRRLNALCFHTLHVAAQAGQNAVSFETVEEAVRQAAQAQSAAPRLPGEAPPPEDQARIERNPFQRDARPRPDAKEVRRSPFAVLRDRLGLLLLIGAVSMSLGAVSVAFAATMAEAQPEPLAPPRLFAEPEAPRAPEVDSTAPPRPVLNAAPLAPAMRAPAPRIGRAPNPLAAAEGSSALALRLATKTPRLDAPDTPRAPLKRTASVAKAGAAVEVGAAPPWDGLGAPTPGAALRMALDPRSAIGRETARHLGLTPLMQAALSGDASAVEAALVESPDAVDAQDALGRTALHYASLSGETLVVKALVRAKARVDAMSDEGVTPLMTAAALGRTRIVDVLLAAGADPTRRNANGETAMDLAEQAGHETVAARLRAQAQ